MSKRVTSPSMRRTMRRDDWDITEIIAKTRQGASPEQWSQFNTVSIFVKIMRPAAVWRTLVTRTETFLPT
jgi:hypothetical protein